MKRIATKCGVLLLVPSCQPGEKKKKKSNKKESCKEASWFINYTTEPFGHHRKSLQILAPVLMENIQFYNNSA